MLQSQEPESSAVPPSATPEVEAPTSPKLTGNESRVEMLIDALIGLIIDVPVTYVYFATIIVIIFFLHLTHNAI